MKLLYNFKIFSHKKLLVLIFLILGTTQGFSQKISLSVDNQKIITVFKRIESKANCIFYYKNSLIDETKKVSFSMKNRELGAVLKELFKNTDISFEIDKDKIYLTKKKVSKKKQSNSSSIKISGVVSDELNLALPGVTVFIDGTNIGTVTDIDGNFSLEITEEISINKLLKFSYIGFASKEELIKNKIKFKIVLSEDAIGLDEVVVTALGIKRSKKVLGYAIQEIKADELNDASDYDVSSALQGKVAGVEITQSGTLGGAAKITIRGNSSLSGNNKPLWIVDGIPFNDNQQTDASGGYAGFDRGGASTDINMDDIESISVLKGPNAAALYGSRAGNGVILVTTKSGSKGKGLGVDFNSSITFDQVVETNETQDKYGRGTGGLADFTNYGSWGAPLDGSLKETAHWGKKPYTATNNMKDYFRTGFTHRNSVSVGKSTEDVNYRIAISYMKSLGVFDKQSLSKGNVDFRGGSKLNDIITLDSKISLAQTDAENRVKGGYYGEMYALNIIPRTVNLSDLKNYSDKDHRHINWAGPSPGYYNPYFLRHSSQNNDGRNRMFGYFKMNLNFSDLFKVSVKHSIDFHTTDFEEKRYGEGIVQNTNEGVSFLKKNVTYREDNSELLIIGQTEISDFSFSYVLGANRMTYINKSLGGVGRNMENYIFSLHSSILPISEIEDLSEKEVQSIFGSTQFSFKDFINLEITGRKDWSSALPSNNRSFFYPSANLSFVATDFLKFINIKTPSWIDFAKFRISAARVGKDCAPGQLLNYYTTQRREMVEKRGEKYYVKYKLLKINDKVKVNKDLKPEITDSYEFGIDVKFFQNRLGFDFTFYSASTINQILDIAMSSTGASSEGFNRKRINAGKILNKGFEMAIYSTPIKMKDIRFDFDINFSIREDIVKELDKENDNNKQVFGDGSDKFIEVVAITGGKVGAIYAKKSYMRNSSNQIIVDNMGLPKLTAEGKLKLIGDIQPDFSGSVRPSLTYKDFSVSALLSFQYGGDIVSYTEAMSSVYGNAKRTENRDDFVFNGVVENKDAKGVVTYSKNKKKISVEGFYNHIVNKSDSEPGIAEEFLYDASYIKLNELSFSYSLPSSFLKVTPLTKVKISLIARNLVYLYKNTPGIPDGGVDMYTQASDVSAQPYSRTLGVSIKLGF